MYISMSMTAFGRQWLESNLLHEQHILPHFVFPTAQHCLARYDFACTSVLCAESSSDDEGHGAQDGPQSEHLLPYWVLLPPCYLLLLSPPLPYPALPSPLLSCSALPCPALLSAGPVPFSPCADQTCPALSLPCPSQPSALHAWPPAPCRSALLVPAQLGRHASTARLPPVLGSLQPCSCCPPASPAQQLPQSSLW